jgi:hypothetical protein
MKARQPELRAIPQFDSGRWKLRLERVPFSTDKQSDDQHTDECGFEAASRGLIKLTMGPKDKRRKRQLLRNVVLWKLEKMLCRQIRQLKTRAGYRQILKEILGSEKLVRGAMNTWVDTYFKEIK